MNWHRSVGGNAHALKDGKPPSAGATKKALDHVLATCLRHKVAAGICFSAEEATMRIEQGWQFLAIGSELRMLLSGTSEIVKKMSVLSGGQDLAKY